MEKPARLCGQAGLGDIRQCLRSCLIPVHHSNSRMMSSTAKESPLLAETLLTTPS